MKASPRAWTGSAKILSDSSSIASPGRSTNSSHAGCGLQLLGRQQPDVGVRAGRHDPAGWGEDLGDGLVRLQILGVRGGQLRSCDRLSSPLSWSARMRRSRSMVMSDVGAELGVEENADGGEHDRQRERESQRELPADGQPAHPVSSVRSR